MKYKVYSIRPTIWNNANLLQLQTKIEGMFNTLIVTTDMPNDTSYQLEKINMLTNDDIDNNDGQPQKSYPPRLLV